MEHPLKRCPNCLGLRFFAEPDETTMVFLSVGEDNSLLASKPPHEVIEDLAGQQLFCTGCGWHGLPEELLPPADAAAEDS